VRIVSILTSESESRGHLKRAYSKIESLGYTVGWRYSERALVSSSSSSSILGDGLEIIKWLCKELWQAMFKKQIDKLQTNYKGVYVLHDYTFRWTQRFYPVHANDTPSSPSFLESIKLYVSFPCGVIRGALANLGLNATVKADLTKLPTVLFTLMDVEKTQATNSANAPAGNLYLQQPSKGRTAVAAPTATAGTPPAGVPAPAAAGGTPVTAPAGGSAMS
jgi:hypothetical protein